MNSQDLENLKKLLGEDLNATEANLLLTENPQLVQHTQWAFENFASLQESPNLEKNLAPTILNRLKPGLWQRFRQHWHWNQLRWALPAIASIALVVTLQSFWKTDNSFPKGTIIQGSLGENSQKIFLVSFYFHAPGVKTVTLSGDFNQWMAVPMQLVDSQKGVFRIDLPVSAGTYTYGFNADGDWKTDPMAFQKIEDGFGQQNSVIRL